MSSDRRTRACRNPPGRRWCGGAETPAAAHAAWVSPEQSYEFGPVAPHTYGLPSWARAKAIALAALVAYAPEEPVRSSEAVEEELPASCPARPRLPASRPARRPSARPPLPSSSRSPRAAPSPASVRLFSSFRAAASLSCTDFFLVFSWFCDSVSVARLLVASVRFRAVFGLLRPEVSSACSCGRTAGPSDAPGRRSPAGRRRAGSGAVASRPPLRYWAAAYVAERAAGLVELLGVLRRPGPAACRPWCAARRSCSLAPL